MAKSNRKSNQQVENGTPSKKKGKRTKRGVVEDRWEKKAEVGRVIKDKFAEGRKIAPLVAKTENQKKALKALREKQLVILSKSAGTGKSELCVWWACHQWLTGECDNIVITRPDKGLGETYPVPGNDAAKILTFLYPLLLKMKKYLGTGVLRNNLQLEDMDVLFKEANGIQIVSMAKLGGMSFSDKTIVIADEVQSATIPQVKALATRAEEGCQILITGDSTQTPIKGQENGLDYLERKLKENPHDAAAVIQFTPEDCCRYGISKHLTRVFEEDGTW